jgi:hypothetical protein
MWSKASKRWRTCLSPRPPRPARSLRSFRNRTGVQVWVSYFGKPMDPHTNYVLWPNAR